MTVKSAQQWSGLIVCKDATGALATPTVGPTGTLYVDGEANAAVVTVSGSNPYKWTVTLPSLTAGQCVSIYITATIATIATASVVAEDVADTVILSDVPAVNVTYLKDVALTETGAGYLAAGFKKLFDVASPVLTAASVNQTGDAYAVVTNTDYGNAKLVRSTTPANTLDVSSTGEAGLDFANIKAATSPTTLTNITVPTVTTTGTASAVTAISTGGITAGSFAAGAIDAAAIADNAIDAGAIADNAIDAGAIASNAITSAKIATGAITSTAFASGAITADAIAANAIGASELAADAVTEIVAGMSGLDIFIYTLTDGSGDAIEDCLVEAFSDAGMTTIVDYGVTDMYGKVRLNLDSPGTYYLKRTKTDYTFTNPDTETLS